MGDTGQRRQGLRHTATPGHRPFWLRTRTKQPLGNFLGFPVDKDVPRHADILDAEEFGGITVHQGCGIGGGSLVDGGMAVTPKREYSGTVLPSVGPAVIPQEHGLSAAGLLACAARAVLPSL